LWTLPSKTTLVSGQGTKTIGVRFDSDFNAGTFRVESVGVCANSKFRALGVYQSPGVVSMINGPTSICELQGNTVTYTIPTVPDATGYVWMVPNSATIVSGQNSTTLQVQYGNVINGTDKIRVRATNSCGGSMIRVMEFSPCASSNFMATGNTSITSSEIQINGFYLSENESSMNISFESVTDSQVIYEFYNLLGQCVFSDQISLTQGITSVKSDLSYLQTGMYQIVVKTHEDRVVTTSYFIK